MARLAQLPHLPPEVTARLRSVVFDGELEVPLRPFPAYSEGYPGWGTPGQEGQLNPPNDGLQGVFARVAAVLFGRPRGYTAAQWEELHAVPTGVVGQEFGRPELPLVADMDFGHSDPQWLLPQGVPVAVDCERPAAWLCRPAVN